MYRNKTFNRKKVMIVFVAVFFIMMFLIGRLVYLMIFCSEYYGNKAENLHERERDIKAARGKLLDANGTVLATNKSVCTISVIHNQIEEPEKVIEMLVRELGIPEETARKRVEKVSSIERVKTNVAKETGDAIRAYGLSGVKVDEDYKRYYPYGTLASKVLGFTGADNQGILGLEVKYDEYLQGTNGKILTLTDARGIEIENAGESRLEPVNGYDLCLSLDYNIQMYCEQAAKKVCTKKSADSVSVIVMNPQNGELMAMVNYPEFDLNNPFTLAGDTGEAVSAEEKQNLLNKMWRNQCISDTYEPGSTFKILTAYAPALDSGSYTLATTVLDEPITYSSGQEIHNADGKYRGYTSIREAIQDSVNVVAVKTVQDITPQAGYEMAKKFGISTLTKDDIVESLPLGVGGVTNLELAAAFEVMPNQGVYKEPVMYTKILDQDGNVLLEKKPKKHRVINDSTAFLLTSAMQDVVLYGTGKLADFGTMPIAGKTGTAGTSEAARDAWFAGYTPYYTCVVWGGYDDYSRLESSRYPKILWNHIMKQLHEGLAYKEFEMPEDVEVSSVCKTSGKIAIAGVCPETETEYFAEGTESSEKCDLHQTAVICKDSGLLAGEYCPESSKETKTFMKKGSGEDKMPTEVCNVHTGEGWLNQLIQALTPENNHTGQ